MNRYRFVLRCDFWLSETFSMYNIGIIQGLLYGACAIPCNTTLWDCEKLPDNTVIFTVDTTEDRCKKCMEIIEQKWPGMCRYEKVREL